MHDVPNRLSLPKKTILRVVNGVVARNTFDYFATKRPIFIDPIENQVAKSPEPENWQAQYIADATKRGVVMQSKTGSIGNFI